MTCCARWTTRAGGTGQARRRALALALVAGLLAVWLPTAGVARAGGIVVRTTDDVNATVCTLRDAIAAANTDMATGGCTAGSGADTITFQSGLTGTIALASDLPTVTTDITVTGPGAATLALDRGGSGPVTVVFTVGTGGRLGLSALTVRNARIGVSAREADVTVSLAGVTLNALSSALSLSSTAVATVTDSIFTANSTSITFYQGGKATVTGSMISGGNAVSFVGGELTLTNSTISTTGYAFFFVTGNDSTATVTNATIVGNLRLVSGGTLSLANTLLAKGSGTNCSISGGTLTNQGHNLADDTSCFADDSGPDGSSQVVSTAQLGLATATPQDNGGPTPTFALLPGSLAEDAGDDFICQQLEQPGQITGKVNGVDQRGVARTSGAHCDIGAYERFVAPQTMLAGVGGTASYGEATATLRATLQRPPSGPGVAGRTVSFTLDGRAAGSATTGADGTAQVAGVPLGARAAGSYARVVCASFAGAGADPPSGPTCGPLKVAKRVLWVQPKAQARAAGAANPGCASVADVQLVAPTPANTGLANGDTLATAVTATPGFFSCTYGVTNGTPAKPSKPGGYTIIASGLTAQNYDIRYKAGTLTVTP